MARSPSGAFRKLTNSRYPPALASATQSQHYEVIETDTDRYGRTVAEAFVSTGNGEEEIYLNAQMVADGMAYTYPQYVGSCPNGSAIEAAEAEARRTAVGVWSSPASQKPWEYRRSRS